jgi:hypothetical protein
MTSPRTPRADAPLVVAALVNAVVNVARFVFTTVPAAPLSCIGGRESLLAGRGPGGHGHRGVTRRPTLVPWSSHTWERRLCNQPAGRGVH